MYTASNKIDQLTVQICGMKPLTLVCVRQTVDIIIVTPTLIIMDSLGYNLILYLSLRTRQD